MHRRQKAAKDSHAIFMEIEPTQHAIPAVVYLVQHMRILFYLPLVAVLTSCGGSDLSCEDLHEGTFEYVGFQATTARLMGVEMIIERKEGEQVEREADGDWLDRMTIEWTSPCAYMLYGRQNNMEEYSMESDTTFVEITNISGKAFDFRCRNGSMEWDGRLIKTSEK